MYYASSKLWKFFTTYDNSPVISATANRSSEPAPSLWLGSFFANSNRHALTSMLTSYHRFDVEIHAEGHHLHTENCRGCGQMLWPCREKKNSEIFFLACFLWFAKISIRYAPCPMALVPLLSSGWLYWPSLGAAHSEQPAEEVAKEREGKYIWALEAVFNTHNTYQL